MIYCVNIYCHRNGVFDNLQNIDGLHYNKDIWAFAYKEDERALNLMCKPVKGRIKEDNYFYEYKANGKDLKKNGVTTYARFLPIHTRKPYGDLINWLEPELVL